MRNSLPEFSTTVGGRANQRVQRIAARRNNIPGLAFEWRVYVQRPPQQTAAQFASRMCMIEHPPQNVANQLVPTLASIDRTILL